MKKPRPPCCLPARGCGKMWRKRTGRGKDASQRLVFRELADPWDSSNYFVASVHRRRVKSKRQFRWNRRATISEKGKLGCEAGEKKV